VKDINLYKFANGNTVLENTPTGGPGRGLACIKARFPDTTQDVKACAMHLEKGYPTNDPAAGVQLRTLARHFSAEARDTPILLMGDTNIPSPDPANTAMYHPNAGGGVFAEIEEERDCVATIPCEPVQGGVATYNVHKLDYVFADQWHFVVPVGAVWHNRYDDCGDNRNEPCSDHLLVHGEVQLPRT
jgi:endonuclease/exonuclease/phosphatase family metal-dependent hydrolase